MVVLAWKIELLHYNNKVVKQDVLTSKWWSLWQSVTSRTAQGFTQREW